VVSRKETIDLVNFDLVSVLKKLIQSYPNALLLLVSKNRFVDGRYARTIVKLMIKVFYYGGRTQKKKGLAEAIWEKKEWNNSSSPTSF
jgi:isochorismate synthase